MGIRTTGKQKIKVIKEYIFLKIKIKETFVGGSRVLWNLVTYYEEEKQH